MDEVGPPGVRLLELGVHPARRVAAPVLVTLRALRLLGVPDLVLVESKRELVLERPSAKTSPRDFRGMEGVALGVELLELKFPNGRNRREVTRFCEGV